MPFEIFCSVKRSVEKEDSLTECSIFLLRDDIDLVDKVIEHRRVCSDGEAVLGTFKVVSFSKKLLVVQRITGSVVVNKCDLFYIDRPVIFQVETSKYVSGFIFEGKNWKLASSKKWQSKNFELPDSGSQSVGVVTLNNLQYDVHKIDNGFIAVPTLP